MTTDNWQFFFNLAFATLLAVMGGGLGYILNQIKGEFARILEHNTREFDRIDRRIDELKQTQAQSAKDFRLDHNTCRAALPNEYVPRAELQAVITRIDQRMDLMTAMLTRIEERLNNKCESLIKRSNPQ